MQDLIIICSIPQTESKSNEMKRKNVIDVCTVDNCMQRMLAIFRLFDLFPGINLNFVYSFIDLLKIVDFEKICTICI